LFTVSTKLKKETDDEVVKVQLQTKLFQLIEQLELPEIYLEERLSIARRLRDVFGLVAEHAPPDEDSKILR
jgi:hypothetical protein